MTFIEIRNKERCELIICNIICIYICNTKKMLKEYQWILPLRMVIVVDSEKHFHIFRPKTLVCDPTRSTWTKVVHVGSSMRAPDYAVYKCMWTGWKLLTLLFGNYIKSMMFLNLTIMNDQYVKSGRKLPSISCCSFFVLKTNWKL